MTLRTAGVIAGTPPSVTLRHLLAMLSLDLEKLGLTY